MATGCDKVFITDIENLVEPERMLPVFSMRDYRRGHADKRRWLVNPWNDDGTLVDLDEYPKLKAYFENIPTSCVNVMWRAITIMRGIARLIN